MGAPYLQNRIDTRLTFLNLLIGSEKHMTRILPHARLACLCATALFYSQHLAAEPADIVFLNGGRILVGSFEEKQGNSIQFRPRNQNPVMLKSNEMLGLLLGYEGTRACLTLRADPKVRDCSVSILALDQTFLFTDKNGQREILPKEISELTFEKKDARNTILPILHPGMHMRLQNTDIEGTIAEAGLESSHLRLPDGRLFAIAESEVLAGKLFQPDRGFLEVARDAWRKDATLFVPGVAGFKSGRILEGLAFASVFSASLAQGFYHHNQAEKTAQKSNDDFAYRLFGIGSYPAEFRTQVRARNTMWGIAMGTFVVHTVRIIWLRRWTPGILELRMESRAVKMGMTFPLDMGIAQKF
ncbi:MAG: hypothetical protein K8S54_21055 [Spirochaetia bacterium]|nr:hypothetical protein [Spirochaetia bacterium]